MRVKGIKQKDIAELTGHSSGTVSDWIRVGIIPKADDVLKIADLLDVSVRFLVTGEKDKELSQRENELLRLCSILNEEKFNVVLSLARSLRNDMDRELRSGSSSAGLEGIKGN
jgi:transcriptional regulator with XRE-family HTH domain